MKNKSGFIVGRTLLAANVLALAMWRNLKNVSRQPMLNKITKIEDKNRSQINNAKPELKMINS